MYAFAPRMCHGLQVKFANLSKKMTTRNRLHRPAKRGKSTEGRDRFRQLRKFITIKKRERKKKFLEELDAKASDDKIWTDRLVETSKILVWRRKE